MRLQVNETQIAPDFSDLAQLPLQGHSGDRAFAELPAQGAFQCDQLSPFVLCGIFHIPLQRGDFSDLFRSQRDLVF